MFDLSNVNIIEVVRIAGVTVVALGGIAGGFFAYIADDAPGYTPASRHYTDTRIAEERDRARREEWVDSRIDELRREHIPSLENGIEKVDDDTARQALERTLAEMQHELEELLEEQQGNN